MANTEKNLKIQDVLEMGLRRKWFIIIPFVFCIIASFGVYKFLPKVYKSSTQILVQAQRIPENYIRPTLTETVSERLNTISQEILSRTRLEKVIKEFNLYADILERSHMEEVVEMMRKKIEVKVQRQNAFSVSFEGEDPKTVMMVTNKLAALFIEENLRIREVRAEGTSDFLSKELQSMEDKLRKKEYDLRFYKERHMGQLPQQMEANLRSLDRLQQQLNTSSQNLRAAEDRIVKLQGQIEQVRERQEYQMDTSSPMQPSLRGGASREGVATERAPESPLVAQLNTLKRDLANAQTKYTESHPDVIDLKRKVANLEPKVMDLLKKQAELMGRQDGTIAESNLSTPAPTFDPVTERRIAQYRAQLNENRSEGNRLREEVKNLREQIALFQRRVDETPKREQEMVQLTRDYDLLRNNYQSLLDKKIQAQMAESLERRQQGEQFMILDLARIPERPIRPDRNKFLIMGAVMGLIAGLGLAWFRESLDQSFHTDSDVEEYLGIPVLATIPNLKEERKAA